MIVAGKGGVGKTTMVAALAHLAAGAGLSVLVIELEGRTGVSTAFGGSGDLGYAGEVLHAAGATDLGQGDVDEGAPHPARHGPRPDDHPRRRPPRVPRRPRDAAVLQAAVVVGDHRHRGRGHPRDPGHPGARQGEADRAAGRRRPGPRGRTGHRAHHDLPVVGRRPARRRPGRTDPGPGRRRGSSPVEPGAMPGGARHPARGDAGQRGRGGRLPARGPGGNRPRAPHRQRLLPRGDRTRRTGGGHGRRGRRRPRLRTCSGPWRRPARSVSAGASSKKSRWRGWPRSCPSPSSGSPTSSPTPSGRWSSTP